VVLESTEQSMHTHTVMLDAHRDFTQGPSPSPFGCLALGPLTATLQSGCRAAQGACTLVPPQQQRRQGGGHEGRLLHQLHPLRGRH
jgi:hypothetical protein